MVGRRRPCVRGGARALSLAPLGVCAANEEKCTAFRYTRKLRARLWVQCGRLTMSHTEGERLAAAAAAAMTMCVCVDVCRTDAVATVAGEGEGR